jgi:hypothetical protein
MMARKKEQREELNNGIVRKQDEKVKIPITVKCLCGKEELKGYLGNGWFTPRCPFCYRQYNIMGGSEMD